MARHSSVEPDDPEVRCVSPEIDDFDLWHGPFTLPDKGALFVTDNRFNHDPEALVPGAWVNGPPTVVEIKRAGRWVRRFYLYDLCAGTNRQGAENVRFLH